MYNAVWTEAESIIFVALQSLVIVILGLLLVSAYTLYLSKNRYWKPVAAIFLIAVSPFILGRAPAYEIQVENEQDIVVDEPFRVNTVVKNPYPIPVWYEGYKSMVLAAYPIGETDPLLIASDAAGMLTGRGILMPWGSKIVGTRTFRHNETGTLEILLILEDQAGTTEKKQTITIKDDLVLIEDISLNRHAMGLPYFGFDLTNYDTRTVTGINVEIDDILLPWRFGVNKENGVETGGYGGGNVDTAWYDPSIGNTTGFYPIKGEEYNVKFLIRYEDGSVRTRSMKVTAENYGVVNSFVGFDHFFLGNECLFLVGGTGKLSLRIINTWYTDEAQNIKHLDVYLNNIKLADVDAYLPVSSYWAFSTDTPWTPDPNKKYNVTVVANSRLDTSRQSKIITCDEIIKET